MKSLLNIPYYETNGLILTLTLSFFLVGPTAFIVGYSFKRFSFRLIGEKNTDSSIYHKLLAFEALGFCLGGLIFTFYLTKISNPMIFTFFPVIFTPEIKGFYKKIGYFVFVTTLTLTAVFSFNSILQKEFSNPEKIISISSHYGPVILTSKSGTASLFYGGSLIATSEDRQLNEEFIHTGISAFGNPQGKKILFIGNALSGQLEELDKYNFDQSEILEIDPLLSDISKISASGKHADRFKFIRNDPKTYIKDAGHKYDIILMNIPSPSSIGLNRFFTAEFFALIRDKLDENGIFVFSLPSKREILSPQFIRFNSSIINALNTVFQEKILIPGDSMLVIASKDAATNEKMILSNFSSSGIKNKFFTYYHLKDLLLPSARSYVTSLMDATIEPNKDFSPSGFLNFLWLEQIKFYPNLIIKPEVIRKIILILTALMVILLLIAGTLSVRISCITNIFFTGFIAISMNFIVFILFQIYCGALYWKLGALISLFMLSLSILTLLSGKLRNYPRAISMIYLLWALSIIILLYNLNIIGENRNAEYILYLYSVICGSLTGASYPLFAEKIQKSGIENKKISSLIYAADLGGAFIGTIICAVFFIPFLGIAASLTVLAMLSLIFSIKNLIF